MKCSRLPVAKLLFLAFMGLSLPALAAEPKVQILSPVDGSRIVQDKGTIFVSGKVARETGRSSNADILLVIDVSGSAAMYAGADLSDADQPPESSGFTAPQIIIGGMSIG
ncbi:MAG TPA: hypothetical protein VJQ55_09295, partial [Candidatus Binatia bacterium]|nr:hypothetical protein [Candidatus Binatia bacterium]